MVYGVGDKICRRSAPSVALIAIAGIAAIKQVRVGVSEIRKYALGSIVVGSERFFPLDCIWH